MNNYGRSELGPFIFLLLILSISFYFKGAQTFERAEGFPGKTKNVYNTFRQTKPAIDLSHKFLVSFIPLNLLCFWLYCVSAVHLLLETNRRSSALQLFLHCSRSECRPLKQMHIYRD